MLNSKISNIHIGIYEKNMHFRVERLNTIDDNNVSLELIQEEYFYVWG